jgi:hypothetical protein
VYRLQYRVIADARLLAQEGDTVRHPNLVYTNRPSCGCMKRSKRQCGAMKHINVHTHPRIQQLPSPQRCVRSLRPPQSVRPSRVRNFVASVRERANKCLCDPHWPGASSVRIYIHDCTKHGGGMPHVLEGLMIDAIVTHCTH